MKYIRVPKKKFNIILTVSPVPLTATITNKHVLDATIYSKSVLRAVAGQLEKENCNIDYFPSYEIISNCWEEQVNYNKNLRTVKDSSVDHVMRVFMNQHNIYQPKEPSDLTSNTFSDKINFNNESDVICEDFLLDSFKGLRK
jgi:hypothetical protein